MMLLVWLGLGIMALTPILILLCEADIIESETMPLVTLIGGALVLVAGVITLVVG